MSTYSQEHSNGDLKMHKYLIQNPSNPAISNLLIKNVVNDCDQLLRERTNSWRIDFEDSIYYHLSNPAGFLIKLLKIECIKK